MTCPGHRHNIPYVPTVCKLLSMNVLSMVRYNKKENEGGRTLKDMNKSTKRDALRVLNFQGKVTKMK